MRRGAAFAVLLAVSALAAAGCGDYRHRTALARRAFSAGEFDRSYQLYKKASRGERRDRLLYLLDEGMALRCARRFDESNRLLQAANALIEELNFTNVGAQALAVVMDDTALPYQGEEFEDVLVNVFGALNYLEAAGPKAVEEARVECRQLDEKLKGFAELRGRQYLQNAFARYLSGLVYELSHEPNDAYIDYKMVHRLRPDFEPVKRDLLRLAGQLGFQDDAAEWEKKFGLPREERAPAGAGEVVLFYECGRSPEKRPLDNLLDLPVYVPRPFRDHGLELCFGDRVLARSQKLEDIEATAVRTLGDRMAPIVARRMASLALKTGAAVGVRQIVKNNTKDRGLADALGWLTFIVLTSMDQADTRSWLTLPANLQVARARLPAGTHVLDLLYFDAAGNPTGHRAALENVRVEPGKITVIVTRTLQ